MKPKTLPVLRLAIEEGVGYGLSRARKHNPDPSDEEIAEYVGQAVLDSICEWFDLEDPQPDET